MGSQYDVSASVASRASGWRWSWLKLNLNVTSAVLVSIQPIKLKIDIKNRIWLLSPTMFAAPVSYCEPALKVQQGMLLWACACVKIFTGAHFVCALLHLCSTSGLVWDRCFLCKWDSRLDVILPLWWSLYYTKDIWHTIFLIESTSIHKACWTSQTSFKFCSSLNTKSIYYFA